MIKRWTLYTIIIFAGLRPQNILAQEASGLVLGNNSGLTAAYINPSFISKSHYTWELQLIGAQGFLDTDYGYVNGSNLFSVINEIEDIQYVEQDNIPNAQSGDIVFKTENSKSHIDTKASVNGPGFIFNLQQNVKVGASYRLRSYATADNIAELNNFYELNNTIIQTEYEVAKSNAAAAIWSEYNLHASYTYNKNLIIGASVKYLQSHSGAYYDFPQDYNFISPDIESVAPTTEGRFSIGATNNDFNNKNIGSGLGIDVGINMLNFIGENSSLGISILDIGAINLSGRKLNGTYNPNSLINRSNYNNIENIDTLFNQINSDFEIVTEENNFTILLPTALSIQYSYPIYDNVNIEAVLTQRIKIAPHQIARSHSFMVAAVYDRKHISAFLPITLYDYKRPKVGLAVRAMYLTIGSDDLLSLIGKSHNFDSTDFYINLRFYPFKIFKKNKSNNDVECFKF